MRAFSVAALGVALCACGGATTTSNKHAGTAAPGRNDGELLDRMRAVKPDGHVGRVTCLSFSPDGHRLVSGAEDRALLVWDVSTGKVVQRMEGHHGFIHGCVFLPGNRVVSGGWGAEVFVWDVTTGETIRQLSGLPAAHDIYSLGVRADGREVIAGTVFGSVIAWDLETGEITFGPRDDLRGRGSRSPVRAVGFLPNDRRFAGGSFGKTIVWGEAPIQLNVLATSGAVLPGGRLALGAEGKVDIAEGESLTAKLSEETGTVYGVAPNPGGDRLLVGDNLGQGRVWDMASRDVRCTLDSPTGYHSAAWAPTGDVVALGGDDGLVRLADARRCSGGAPLSNVRILGESRARVAAVAASASSVSLGDSAGRISTWSTTDWHFLESAQVHTSEVLSMVLFPDGRRFSGGNDRAVMLTDHGVTTSLAKLTNPVFAMAALPDGEHVITGDGSGDVTQVALGETPLRHWTAPKSVYSVAITPDGMPLVGGTWSTIVRVQIAPGQKGAEWPDAFGGKGAQSTTALTALPDGRFAQGSTGGDVLLRRGETVEKRFQGLSEQVTTLSVTGPFLWGSGGKKLVRWKLDGPVMPDIVLLQRAEILRFALTPNGFLVAGIGDGSVAVHRLEDGSPVAHLYPFRDGSGATVYSDGRFFVTEGEARSLRFEDPVTRRVMALGTPLSSSISTPHVSPLPDGSVAIHATAYSPSGPPSITLDDGWTIESVTPSPTVSLAYDIDFQWTEPRGGAHTLTVQPPEGAKVQATFKILPDPRRFPTKTRALVIANSGYESRDKVPGAAKDGAVVKAFLEGDDGWHLPADRIDFRADLRGVAKVDAKAGDASAGTSATAARDPSTLSGVVTDFFARAEPDETLFFYFSGHGESDATKGYLLPVDAPQKTLENALSVEALWSAVRASKAARVIVVVEACRTKWLTMPRDLALPDNAVLLAPTFPDLRVNSLDPVAPFTRALLDAMQSAGAVDIDQQAVTVSSAFRAVVADPKVWAQTPAMIGAGDVLQLPLAWPPRRLDRRAATEAQAEAARGGRIRSAKGVLVTPIHASVKGDGDDILERRGNLELRIVLESEAEVLKISAFQSRDGDAGAPRKPPSLQRIEKAPSSKWPVGKELSFSLHDLKADQGGFVTVSACSSDGKKCDALVSLTLPAPIRQR